MKYVGSKRRIAKDIAPIICKDTTVLYEPFVGGGNFTMYVADNYPRIEIHASDINYELICMWKELQKGWNPPENISEELYKAVKKHPMHYPPELVAYVGYGSFGAKLFGGYRRYSDNRNAYQEHFRDVTRNRLLHVQFSQKAYWEINPKDATIYCDPPYKGALGYAYENYTMGWRYKFDHDHFWNWVRQVSKENTVYVSEYSAPDDFTCIWQKDINQWIDKSNGYTKRIEKLWRYYGN